MIKQRNLGLSLSHAIAGAVLAWAALQQWAIAAEKPVFMWKLQQGQSTIYLLGSMHAAKADLYPLDPRIEKAYAASDVLVVEANILEGNPMALAGAIMSKASYPPDDSLDKHVSPEVFKATAAMVEEAGLSMEQFNRVRPWFLAMTVTMMKLQELGIAAEQGIDLYFLQQAQGKKTILELESAVAQLELLSNFSDKEQEMFLKYTISELDKLEQSIHELITTWKAGDARKLDELLRSALKDAPETKTVFTKLFDERNVKMAAKIEEYAKTNKNYFVVVGAGHLVGENGLIQLLGKKHKVEQM